MIRGINRGSFKDSLAFLDHLEKADYLKNLDRFGQMGVFALSGSTPKRSGATASSWRYRIVKKHDGVTIQWYNTHNVGGHQIALLIQYGHGTGTGGYIRGIDYVNPAMRPIFETIADSVWKEVVK